MSIEKNPFDPPPATVIEDRGSTTRKLSEHAWHAIILAGLFAGIPMGYAVYGLLHNAIYSWSLPPGEIACGTANLGFVFFLFPIGPILGGIGALIGYRL